MEMECWWDKEQTRLSALPDLHNKQEIQKRGNGETAGPGPSKI